MVIYSSVRFIVLYSLNCLRTVFSWRAQTNLTAPSPRVRQINRTDSSRETEKEGKMGARFRQMALLPEPHEPKNKRI